MPTATLDQDTQRQERLARLAANRSVPPTNGQTAVTRTARRHAARGSRMTALALSIATTGGLAYGFASADHAVASTATASVPTVPAATQPPANQPPANGTSGAGTGAAVVPAVAGGTGSGSFTGATVNTRWGPVQVSITVASGQLSEVTARQIPGGRSKSVQINDYAMPVLRQEALQAQSATIDSVSGATYTSTGYVQSLQAAIDQARSAGVLVTA